MLHALPNHPEVVRTLGEARDVLGCDPLGLDNDDALRTTVAAQLSLLLAGVATARVLAAQGDPPTWSQACRSAPTPRRSSPTRWNLPTAYVSSRCADD